MTKAGKFVKETKYHPHSWYKDASSVKRLLRISEHFSESKSTLILLKPSKE